MSVCYDERKGASVISLFKYKIQQNVERVYACLDEGKRMFLSQFCANCHFATLALQMS
jgi:hypothetical protein